MSRTTVQRVTNLDLQTDEVRGRCQHFDDQTKRLNSGEELAHGDAPNVNPADWGADLCEFDQEFQDEFDRVVSDPSLPEADELLPLTRTTILTSTWSWHHCRKVEAKSSLAV